MRRIALAAIVLAALCVGIAQAGEKWKLGVVAKVGGVPWANAIEEGVKQDSEELGIQYSFIGPTGNDPANQVRAVEDLIAQGVNVIGVVPNDMDVLEPVFKRAMDAGIKIITHEGPGQPSKDWDFEMVANDAMAIANLELMAKHMNYEGEYVVYVGSLTVPMHNIWADESIKYQLAKYPKMKMLEDRFPVAESVDDSLRTANELINKYPNLKGFLCYGSQGPIGAGRAVQQKGLKDKIAVVGTYSPSQAQRLVESGDIKGGYTWNPMQAGRVFVQLAKILMDGKEVVDGMEIPKFGKVTVDSKNRVIFGDMLDDLGMPNIYELIKLGL